MDRSCEQISIYIFDFITRCNLIWRGNKTDWFYEKLQGFNLSLGGNHVQKWCITLKNEISPSFKKCKVVLKNNRKLTYN